AFAEAWSALGGGPHAETALFDEPVLAAYLPVADLALATVAACACAAAELAAARGRPVPEPIAIRADRVATAFTSERHLRRGGQSFPGFQPESGFFPAADGWVRTHANYPHHLARLRSVVGADVAAGIARRPARQVEEDVYAAGGLAVAVRPRAEWTPSRQPLI